MRNRLVVLILMSLLVGALGADALITHRTCYNLVELPQVNNFVLVIDKSGSMNGNGGMITTRKGAKALIENLKTDDAAAVVAFDGDVEVVQRVTTNHQALKNAIDGIKARGNTALYDAVARALLLLKAQQGPKIVVFLTDGRDNSSRFTLKQIQSMCVGEGLYVYGIGLGDIDTLKLADLTKAAGGNFEIAKNADDLVNLYPRILEAYYKAYGNSQKPAPQIIVRSIPANQRVMLNDKEIGWTPLMLNNPAQGAAKVTVEFDRGDASCQVQVKQGWQTNVDLRASDLGKDIVVMSYPRQAAVFIDDQYVGLTSIVSPTGKEDDWEQKALSGNQLVIPNVPLGRHSVTIKGMGDSDIDFDGRLDMNLNVNLKPQTPVLILYPNTFYQRLQTNSPEEAEITNGFGGTGGSSDPFDALDGIDSEFDK